VPNPIVITGDIHAAWVADLKYHLDDPNNSFKRTDAITIGTEFLGTSINSGLSKGWIVTYRNALGANPHVKSFDSRQGGYVRCDLDSDRFRADFLLANSLGDRLSPVRTIASFEVYPESEPSKREGAKQVYREALLGPPRWIGIGADGVLRADGPYERGWYNTDNTTGQLYPEWFRP
jgi:phosphodiesterase/alkaline phosphatase D-like protein